MPIWKETSDGAFSVKSEYHMLSGEANTANQGTWRRIWKLHAPQRCKTFMCLCARDRFLTNSARKGRGTQCSEDCPTFVGVKEDELHALRDCRIVRACWMRSIPAQMSARFFNFRDVREWITWNLKQNAQTCWSELGRVVCHFMQTSVVE